MVETYFKGAEFDFLNWKSFPSSLKGVCTPEQRRLWVYERTNLPVQPGKKLHVEMMAKQENVLPALPLHNVSYIIVDAGWERVLVAIELPNGTYDWRLFKSAEVTVPSDVRLVNIRIACGFGTPKGITWFDDLKIYQDNELIYANDFTKWDPYIGAGAGGVGGALAGYLITKNPLYALIGIPTALIGAAVGYYTAKP
jgi:hypothetical protein